MPSTMAPTKAMARYAVTTLSLPANVMTSLLGSRPPRATLRATLMVNRESPFEKVSLAVARCRQGSGARGPIWLKNTEMNVLKSL